MGMVKMLVCGTMAARVWLCGLYIPQSRSINRVWGAPSPSGESWCWAPAQLQALR